MKSSKEWATEFGARHPGVRVHITTIDLERFIIDVQKDTVEHCSKMAQEVVGQTLNRKIGFAEWNELPRLIKKGSKSAANLHFLNANPYTLVYYQNGEATDAAGNKVIDKEDFE